MKLPKIISHKKVGRVHYVVITLQVCVKFRTWILLSLKILAKELQGDVISV